MKNDQLFSGADKARNHGRIAPEQRAAITDRAPARRLAMHLVDQVLWAVYGESVVAPAPAAAPSGQYATIGSNVVSLEAHRPVAEQQPSQATPNQSGIGANVVSLDAYRQAKEAKQTTILDESDDAEAEYLDGLRKAVESKYDQEAA